MKPNRPAKHHKTQQPLRVRLPGFLIEREIGLGDAIHRLTSAVGVRHCGACARRAAALNRWIKLTR